ncbi:MAG: glucose-6-phosphate isomerase [Pseudomonadota bacterium]
MSFSHDFAVCIEAAPDGRSPIDAAAYAALLAEADQHLAALQREAAEIGPSLLTLPDRRDDLDAIEAVAARWRTAFDDIVILGVGGSSLGAQALYALTQCPVGVGANGKHRCPRLHFIDNSDPLSLDLALARLDPANTGFIAVSKSGGTVETLMQLFVAWRAVVARLGEASAKRHFLAITEPKASALRDFATKRGLSILDHPDDLGGRYSCLSIVGLLPAMLAGMDATAVRAGAKSALHEFLGATAAADVRSAMGAALSVASMRSGRNISVMMAYADRLEPFTRWWAQLWAESLGKDGLGPTPALARGATDQHSQLQLYLDGPDDKLFTVICVEAAGQGDAIDPRDLDDRSDLAYLAGNSLGDLIDAHARATIETLRQRGRPVRVIRLGRLKEQELGVLMMHFMLETVFAGRLLGVDPFDQPAVESGKILAREYLSAAAQAA